MDIRVLSVYGEIWFTPECLNDNREHSPAWICYKGQESAIGWEEIIYHTSVGIYYDVGIWRPMTPEENKELKAVANEILLHIEMARNPPYGD